MIDFITKTPYNISVIKKVTGNTNPKLQGVKTPTKVFFYVRHKIQIMADCVNRHLRMVAPCGDIGILFTHNLPPFRIPTKFWQLFHFSQGDNAMDHSVQIRIGLSENHQNKSNIDLNHKTPYNSLTTKKKVVEIRPSLYTSAKAPFKVFFYVRFMMDCLRHLRMVASLVCNRSNLKQPIAHSLDPICDGYYKLTRGKYYV